MDKQRLEQILQVLILPYTERDFIISEKDFIKEHRYSYWKLKYRGSYPICDELELNYFLSGKKISTFFREHAEYHARNLDDIILLLDMFYPEEEMAIRMENLEKQIEKTLLMPSVPDIEIADYIYWQYLSNIYEIAKSLLTFRDGKIALRTWFNPDKDIFDYPRVFDKIEIWNQLSRLMTTDIIIVAFFVLCNLRDEQYLFNQSGTIMLADKTLERVFRKGLAETHLHFNAGVDFQFLWQHRMNPLNWQRESDRRRFLSDCKEDMSGFPVMIYRFFWSEYLENRKNENFCEYVEKSYPEEWKTVRKLLIDMRSGRLADVITDDFEFHWKEFSSLIDSISLKHGTSDSLYGADDYLLETVFKAYGYLHTSGELILLFKSLWYFREAINDKEAEKFYLLQELALFLQYIRIKNLFFGSIVRLWTIEGLSNFRNAYSNMSRRLMSESNKEKRYKVIFKSISQNVFLKKLEVRITPPIEYYGIQYIDNQDVLNEIQRKYLNDIRSVLSSYRNSMLESAGLDSGSHSDKEYYALDDQFIEHKLAFPTVGIVFHFIKQNHIGNKIGDKCWIVEEDAYVPLYKDIIAMRRAMTASAKVLERMRSSIPLLSEYVVGLDAASEELATEPWVFAPVFKAIRQKQITKPLVRDKYGEIGFVNNLGFTYHVGEEFRHILSGLRYVDEVINKFQYKAGDRLGHALSLGISIDYWMRRNEAVIIPLQEYLEDLLWLWGKRVYENWDVSFDMDVIEGQILDYVKRVLGDVSGLTLPVIYESYRLKFEDNYEEIFAKIRKLIAVNWEDIDDRDSSEGHLCRFYSTKSPYGLIWTPYKIFCTFFCPVYKKRYNQPILVHVEKNTADLFKSVQKAVVQEVELKGIYIETNPTSNLSVGQINSLKDISIMNLNARELSDEKRIANEVLATVNSDNPVIFSTNCENEHAYVYHALTSYGYPKERVLQWIDKIRQMGVDSSFIKNIKKPSSQLKEIDRLLGIIERELEIVP